MSDMFIFKWSFGAVFLSIPIIFLVKVGALVYRYAHIKWVEFQAWLHNPDLLKNITHAVWEAIKGGIS